nr:MAG TPA: hypothetical protein [Caudoviricetes sp.]
MNGYWVIRTYEAGSVGEKIKYWVPGERPKKSVGRTASDIRKVQQNEASAVKRLARIINANFTQGDILLGLDYDSEGYKKLLSRSAKIKNTRKARGDTLPEEEAEEMECIRQAAEQEMTNFLRRVKRAGEIKYIAVTSDMDGKTGESVRVHHHLVINREALEACKEKWGLGGVNYNGLSGQADYTDIAAYLMEQVRRIPDAKKYTASRNLTRPAPKDRVALNGSELRVPKGGQLLHRNEFSPGMPQYIRYILPHKKDPVS